MQLKIVTWAKEELASDALSVHGYERYQAADYALAAWCPAPYRPPGATVLQPAASLAAAASAAPQQLATAIRGAAAAVSRTASDVSSARWGAGGGRGSATPPSDATKPGSARSNVSRTSNHASEASTAMAGPRAGQLGAAATATPDADPGQRDSDAPGGTPAREDAGGRSEAVGESEPATTAGPAAELAAAATTAEARGTAESNGVAKAGAELPFAPSDAAGTSGGSSAPGDVAAAGSGAEPAANSAAERNSRGAAGPSGRHFTKWWADGDEPLYYVISPKVCACACSVAPSKDV